MWRCLAALVVLGVTSLSAAETESVKPFLGRWDFTVSTPTRSWPQWLEITEKDGVAQGRVQPEGGPVRPVASVAVEGGHLIVTIGKGGQRQGRVVPATVWDLSLDGSAKLVGLQKQGENVSTKLAGVRAPDLKRPEPSLWSAPVALFNGKDLTGWEPLGDAAKSHWVVSKSGELFNEARGPNIATTPKFDDFKLHIEANCPDPAVPAGEKQEFCNSGIYLRGRYEIQVGSEGGMDPTHEMGAVYGYFPARGALPVGAGEWQILDITFVGRTVTVIRNGVTLHDHQEIPGITGGALDSNEGAPGPLFIQGDHVGGMKYRNITISVPAK